MKKLLEIVILVLLLSGKANSSNVTTIYCESKFWAQSYVTLNIDYVSKLVQHPKFKAGKAFSALITDTDIFFETETELWHINRVSGRLDRHFGDVHQIGMCTKNEPKIKQKF